MAQTFSSITEYPAGAQCPGLPKTVLEVKVHNNIGSVIHAMTTDAGTGQDVIVATYYVFTDKDGTETEVLYDSQTWNNAMAETERLRFMFYNYKVDHMRVKITQTGNDGGIIRVTANVSKGA